MVGAFGMGGTLVSLAAGAGGPTGGDLTDRVLADAQCREAVDRLLEQALGDAKAIVWRERPVLEALRDALVARDELVGHEILEVIEGVPGVAGRGRATSAPPPRTGTP